MVSIFHISHDKHKAIIKTIVKNHLYKQKKINREWKYENKNHIPRLLNKKTFFIFYKIKYFRGLLRLI